jgi:hypothetical protein
MKNGIEYWYEETPYHDKEKKQIRNKLKYLGKNLNGQPTKRHNRCSGGIGKNQLVVEFCHQYRRFFYGVHWIQMPISQIGSNVSQSRLDLIP